MFSFPECIAWLAVGLMESVAIVTLNIITIIVFFKNRNLRKRGTYLIISLAVADMLVGVYAAYLAFYGSGENCNLWKPSKHWAYRGIAFIFTFSSLINITSIALERLHATMWPFRHRLIKKSVYVLIISVLWVAAVLLSVVTSVLMEVKGYNYGFYFWNSSHLICLLTICVSYTSIVIKVRCGAQPQHHVAVSRENSKLTMTLLIVTFVSLVLYLPDNFYHILSYTTDIISSMSTVTSTRLHDFLNFLFYANSLVNPILYAIRMPEYRSAVLALFRRRHQQQRQAAALPLHDL